MTDNAFLLTRFSAEASRRFQSALLKNTEVSHVDSVSSSAVLALDESIVSLMLSMIACRGNDTLCISSINTYVDTLYRLTEEHHWHALDCMAARVSLWFAEMSADVMPLLAASLEMVPLIDMIRLLFQQDIYVGMMILSFFVEVYKKFSAPALATTYKGLRSVFSTLKDMQEPSKQMQSCRHSVIDTVGCHYLCEVMRDSAFCAHHASLRHDILVHFERESFFVYFTKLIIGHYQIDRLAIVGALMIGVLPVLNLTEEGFHDFERRFRQRFSSPSLSLYLLCLPRQAFGELQTVSLIENTSFDVWYCVALMKKHCMQSYCRVKEALCKEIHRLVTESGMVYGWMDFPVTFPQEDSYWSAISSWQRRDAGLAALLILLRGVHKHFKTIREHMMVYLSDVQWDTLVYRLGCQCLANRSSWQCTDRLSVVAQAAIVSPVMIIATGSLLFVSFLCTEEQVCVSDPAEGDWIVLCDIRQGSAWHIQRTSFLALWHMILSADLSHHPQLNHIDRVFSVPVNTTISVSPEWDITVHQSANNGEHDYVLKKQGKVIGSFRNVPALKRQMRARLAILDQPLSIGEAASAQQDGMLTEIYYSPVTHWDQRCLEGISSDFETALSASYQFYVVPSQVKRPAGNRWDKRFALLGIKEKSIRLYDQARMRLYSAMTSYCAADEESPTAWSIQEALCLDLEDAYLTMDDWIAVTQALQKQSHCLDVSLFWQSPMGQRWARLLYRLRFNLCGPEGEFFRAYCERSYHAAHNIGTT